MRIYALADIHANSRHMETLFSVVYEHRPDVVVAAGDLTHFFRWSTCLSQLDSLRVPVLAIRGNSDFKRITAHINRANNLTALTSAPFVFKDLSFVGADGTLVLPFFSKVCWKEEERLSGFGDMDRNTVMVVHPPPRGVLDRVGGRFHAGSRGLERFIRKAQPGLVLCGHIHEQAGMEQIGESVVVNCSLSRKSAGALIDMEKDCPPRVNLLQP